MVIVVFDSWKVFTLKVFDSSWLWDEARVTEKLKPDAVCRRPNAPINVKPTGAGGDRAWVGI